MTSYSDATLLSWLATRPEKLERHLDRHPEDIDRLDRLTALSDHQVAAMEHTVSPPEHFAAGVISRLTLDPGLREAGSVFADLFSIGFRTLQVVLGGPDEQTGDPAGDPAADRTADGAPMDGSATGNDPAAQEGTDG